MEIEGQGIQPEDRKAPRTEIDLGAGKIIGLATEAGGLNIRTKQIIGKREDITDYPLTEAEKEQLGTAVARESRFQGAEDVRTARDKMLSSRRLLQDARLSGAPPDVIGELNKNARFDWTKFEGQRADYGIGGKVGFAEIDIQGNNVALVIKEVPFPTYAQFAKDTSREELKKLSPAAGTAVVLRTSDGKLIITHRSEKNRKYKGIAGIPGGMVDATKLQDPDKPHVPTRKRGAPDPVTTKTLEENVMKEVDEEIGLQRENFGTVIAAGIGYDNKTPHPEVFFMADANLTFNEILEKARKSVRNNELSPTDFDEKYTAIDATPRAVEILLTQIKHPLPPTHAAALMAAAHSLILNDQTIPENSRLVEANSWISRVSAKVKQNYDEMEQIVGKSTGYNPEKLPEMQGLLTFTTAMSTLEIALHPGEEMRTETDEQRKILSNLILSETDENLANIAFLHSKGVEGIHDIVERTDSDWDGITSAQYAFGRVNGDKWVNPPSDPDTRDVFYQHLFEETRAYLRLRGYEVVDVPQPGDVIGYARTREFRNGGKAESFEHFGIYNGPDVTSRFPRGGVYRHDPDVISFDHTNADTKVFFRKTVLSS